MDVVDLLIAYGANVNAANNEGQTPLHETASGWPPWTEPDNKTLIAAGADVNPDDWTALHEAALYGNAEVIAILLDNGADVNARDNLGQTPLHVAARDGPRAIIELLLAHGADVGARDGHNTTAAHAAAYARHKDIVKLLEDAAGKAAVR